MPNTKHKFYNKIILTIFTTDIPNNKKYILSKSDTDIVLPEMYINKDNYKDIKQSVIDYLQTFIMASPLELIPTLISLNSPNLPDEHTSKDTTNIVYAVLVTLNNSINDQVFWQEFNYVLPNKYSNLIFEVLQNLT